MPSTPDDGTGERRVSRRSLLAGLGAVTGVGLGVYGTGFYVPDDPSCRPHTQPTSHTRPTSCAEPTAGTD